MPITLSPETTKKLQAKAGLFLDCCLKEIGPAGRGKA